MAPRLIALTGPRKGEVIPITRQTMSAGRDASCDLPLQDKSVSRKHCLFEKREESFQIRDLDSLNGILVNRLPVRERLLEHGDQIEIGSSTFLFLLQDEQLEATVVGFDAEPVNLKDTIPLMRSDAIYLHPEKLSPDVITEKVTGHLKLLLQISRTLLNVRNKTELCHLIVQLGLQATLADRAALLLTGPSLETPEIAVSHDRKLGRNVRMQISRTVVNEVLKSGNALLCTDISQSDQLSAAKSVIESAIRSVLCVPVSGRSGTPGVLYLDSSSTSNPLREDDLQIMTAAANYAGLALENLQHYEWLVNENERLQHEDEIKRSLIGESKKMQEVYKFIAKVAPVDSTVLISGESGTGKELVARALHNNSARKSGPFVAINCAVLTESLLENELFGHEKGAFTGAIAQKKGKIEFAHGGTLFLDEVAELSPAIQSKLLRVLQEREFERVGGNNPIRVDIRVLGATNQDLKEAVKNGKFRQDLFYRLNVVSVTLPPLRDRKEDIPLLTGFFVRKCSENVKRKVEGVSPAARQRLTSYDWPGNVRELENAIEHAIVLGSTDIILPEDLPEQLLEAKLPAPADLSSYHESLAEHKKRLILEALKKTGGNYTEAARALGLHPNYLHRLIRNLDIRAEARKADEGDGK